MVTGFTFKTHWVNTIDSFSPCLNCPLLQTFQDSQNPDDKDRQFILSYFLYNDTISIYEKSTPNSGIIGGKFLEKKRIPKPGSTLDSPKFYTPADLAIGATVEGNILCLIACVYYSVIMSLFLKGTL